MSRIGNAPISLPKGVELQVSDKNLVTAKGPKGELHQEINPAIKVAVQEGQVLLTRSTEQKQHRALHGLYRALINNMVKGVSEGYNIELELVGVGYRATAKGQLLELSLGYSHNVAFELPKEVKFETKAERGQTPRILLASHDKQLLGQVVAKITSLRKPEPYKGKGIKVIGRQYRRKAGKTASK
ncbi:MAG: 50S ribosomal protein L6 [Flavobacteriales bacterium]|nr:50S ribosomal protein L6 [Flavobacteriales bacterium]